MGRCMEISSAGLCVEFEKEAIGKRLVRYSAGGESTEGMGHGWTRMHTDKKNMWATNEHEWTRIKPARLPETDRTLPQEKSGNLGPAPLLSAYEDQQRSMG